MRRKHAFIAGAAVVGLATLAATLVQRRMPDRQASIELEDLSPATSTQTLEYAIATKTSTDQPAQLSDEEILRKLYARDTPGDERTSLFEQLSETGKKEFREYANTKADEIRGRFDRLRDEWNNPEKYWT